MISQKKTDKLLDVLAGLDISMENISLLTQALIHPTYVYEHKKRKLSHNQRLEFLGDAVLGLVMGEYLYENFPEKPEGDLTKMRAAVVCEASLAQGARKLNLGNYLYLGRGEEQTGGRERSSVLADAMEAVAGAIYLELGLEAARKFLLTYLSPQVEELNLKGSVVAGDYKTALQEWVQQFAEEGISYKTLKESGPDHQKSFVAGVIYRGEILARGEGSSKKEAEQAAAQTALNRKETWSHLISRNAGKKS